MRVERVAGARPIFDAGIDEFLFESREDRQALRSAGLAQRGDGAAQKSARAAFPGLPVRGHDVAEIEPLGMLAEFDLDLGAGVGHQHHFALGAERRLQDRAERRHHDVARRQADPDAHPRRQIGGRKPLAAHQPGQIAGAKKDERFGFHVGVGSLVDREAPQDRVDVPRQRRPTVVCPAGTPIRPVFSPGRWLRDRRLEAHDDRVDKGKEHIDAIPRSQMPRQLASGRVFVGRSP